MRSCHQCCCQSVHPQPLCNLRRSPFVCVWEICWAVANRAVWHLNPAHFNWREVVPRHLTRLCSTSTVHYQQPGRVGGPCLQGSLGSTTRPLQHDSLMSCNTQKTRVCQVPPHACVRWVGTDSSAAHEPVRSHPVFLPEQPLLQTFKIQACCRISMPVMHVPARDSTCTLLGGWMCGD